MKAKDLIHDDKNFNKGSESGAKLIKKWFEKFGAGRSILVDKNSRMIAGNKSVEFSGIDDVQIVESDGTKLIAVKRTDIDLDTPLGREMALADNASAKANIVFDAELIEAEVGVAVAEEWGIEMPKVEPEVTEDDFDVDSVTETDIVLGDLFEIGEHRLLCGDSTDSDSVAKLMNGEKADITFTSPPYNAGDNALGGNKNMVDNKYELYNDNKEQSDWKEFISDVLKNCLINSENVFYNIQQLAGNKIGFIEFLYEYKNQFVDEIIWIKGHGQPAAAKNVLNSRFEHILIYRNEDCPKRTITTGDFHGTISNYYEGNGQTKNEFSGIHAATFPIHLPEYIITNFSKNSVLDVFIGTGTTMVAAHQLKRKCYGMELDPKYCQVIIDRMRKLDPSIVIKKNGHAI